MATTKEILHSIRIQGNNGNFGTIAARDFTRQLNFEQLTEKTIDVPSTMINEHIDFTGFTNGYATFVFLRGELSEITVRLNSPSADIYTIPAGGMVMLSGTGVTGLYLSGQPAGDARVHVIAAGD